MTSPRWNLWRASGPPADFADRIVAELVLDGRRRRARRRRPSILVAAFAAVMVAGGACGFASLSARSVRQHAPAKPVMTTTQAATRAATAAPLVPSGAPPAPPPPPPTRPARSTPAPAGVGHDAGRKVILPHCNCSPNESICDCF